MEEAAMMGTDIEFPSSTTPKYVEILEELVNSTRLEDRAIQVASDVTASLEKIAEDGESMDFIPRVPEILREGANGAHDPQVISIGPYHWGKPLLRAMEKHKKSYLVGLLKLNPERSLRDYIKEIEALELRLRSCYDEDIHRITSKDFLKMMLVDGCFLVEFGLQNMERVLNPSQRRLFNLMNQDILIMLENQLPFFLLPCIYDIATKNLACPSSFIQVALEFIGSTDSKLSRGELSTPIMLKNELPKTIHHYLQLFHSVYVYARRPIFNAPSQESSCSRMTRACIRLCQKVTFDVFPTSAKAATGRHRRSIPSASELHDLGIKFKISKSRMPYHIKFHRGVMEIALLYVSSRTSRTTLNLIAFERFDFEAEPCLIAFYKFFDLLVNTSNDVALLRRYDIIHHQMGSDEELALFFSQVTKGILNDRSPLSNKVYDKTIESWDLEPEKTQTSITGFSNFLFHLYISISSIGEMGDIRFKHIEYVLR